METLHPQQLTSRGQAEYHNGNYISAAEYYKAAAEAYKAGSDEVNAAEMWNNCSVAYLKGGNAHAALQAAVETDLIFSAKGDIKQQAMALGNQAGALDKLKRYDEAMIAYERCAGLLKDVGEFELRLYAMQAISMLHFRKRNFLVAYAALREGYLGLKKPNFKQRIVKLLIQIPYNFMR